VSDEAGSGQKQLLQLSRIACNFHYFRVSSLLSIMRRYNCARGGLAMKGSDLIPVERIEKAIYVIRGEKVMLDRDLADLYGVPTKAFNQAVKRHADRFPSDFMFQLTMQEAREWWSQETPSRLRSRNVTLKRGQHIYFPYANSSIISANRVHGIRFVICRFPPFHESEPWPMIIVPIFSLSA
jgi:hypothetical protein